MSVCELTVPIAGSAPAVLILPQPVTPEALVRLEQEVASTLSELRQTLDDGAAERGSVEYESWIAYLAALAA